MTRNEFAERQRIDLTRQIDEHRQEEGRLSVRVQEIDAEIDKSDARIATGIAGVKAGEATTLRLLKRDKAAAEAKVAERVQIREGDEALLAQVDQFLEHTSKGK